MVDLERKRSEFAVDTVNEWLAEGERAGKIGERLPGLPVTLRTQGLLTTCLTLRTKEGGNKVADALQAWLTRVAPRPPLSTSTADADFVALCTNAARVVYLAAQWEAIEMAQKLELAAEALELTKGK